MTTYGHLGTTSCSIIVQKTQSETLLPPQSASVTLHLVVRGAQQCHGPALDLTDGQALCSMVPLVADKHLDILQSAQVQNLLFIHFNYNIFNSLSTKEVHRTVYTLAPLIIHIFKEQIANRPPQIINDIRPA